LGRKAKNQIIEASLGQHLALSVAAHLARSQLVPDPLRAYDAQHLISALDAIATALVRVAPLYVRDISGKEPRLLDAADLQGATVRRGATVLVLKDGRAFSAVSIKRTDLRQAMAVLRTVGIRDMPNLVPAGSESEKRPALEDPMPRLREQLREMEQLLRPPLIASQVERANSIAISIARHAPHGHIANHAMRLMSAVTEARDGSERNDEIPLAMARLKAALYSTAADISQSRTVGRTRSTDTDSPTSDS